MLKSVRVSVVFAGLIVLTLALSQFVFAGGVANQSKKPATSKSGSSRMAATKSKKKDEPPANVTATAGQLVISEFRVRGPNGANDEFIVIFNASGADHTVDASGTGTGYGVAASDGVLRCTIPNGAVIPNRGHYLCVNSLGYSLASYPLGNGTTATGEATYTTDIPDNAGIALFNTNVPAEFALATRLDAVGSTSEANSLYTPATSKPETSKIPTYTTNIPDNSGIALFNTNVPGEFALATRLDAVSSTSEANKLYNEPATSNPETSGIAATPTKSKKQPPVNITATAGQLVISEFRVRGPNGANDEFIEIFNNSGADHTVDAASGSGYGIAASNGVTRCSIPNGTVIPNRGHYLCVNSVGYSLASYPAGNGTTATGDATYTTDIPDNAGIALFNNNTGGASYSLANRLDAVGSMSEANTLYKEGTGYPTLTPFSIDYSFYRDNCGKAGSITFFGACPSGGNLLDTNNNAADFVFVDTNGTSAGAGQRLGAPGPENLSSPIERNAVVGVTLLDPCVGSASPPNRVRDFTSDPANNSTFGTLDIRRTITNNTGANVTRLRFRVVDLTTFPAPSGIADLRPRTSTAVVVTVDRAPCGSGTSNVTVQGTTLEQPASQPNGGGFNSSMSAGTVTLGTPLANGGTIDVRFLLGLQQTGSFKFYVNIEALP